jgi:hypothetical protein
MGRALAVGAAAALHTVLLFETALAWVSGPGPDVVPGLFLLLAYVGIGAAAGHAAVSLTGGIAQSWPAVLVVAGAGAILLGWGHGSALLHPMLDSSLAGAGAGACTAAGGWLGLVLPNLHRAVAPPRVLADQPTVELRALPSVLIAGAVAGRGRSGRHHARPSTRPVGQARPVAATTGAGEAAFGPEILDFGG